MSTYTGVTNFQKTVRFFWPTLYITCHKNAEICFKNFQKTAFWNSSLRHATATGALEDFYVGAQPHSLRYSMTSDYYKHTSWWNFIYKLPLNGRSRVHMTSFTKFWNLKRISTISAKTVAPCSDLVQISIDSGKCVLKTRQQNKSYAHFLVKSAHILVLNSVQSYKSK